MTDQEAQHINEWLILHQDADQIVFGNDGTPKSAYYAPRPFGVTHTYKPLEQLGHEPKGSMGS